MLLLRGVRSVLEVVAATPDCRTLLQASHTGTLHTHFHFLLGTLSRVVPYCRTLVDV